jgi:hypothetical protein
MDSLAGLMQWLESTTLATAINQAKWLFTTVEVIHVIAISLVLGSIATVDLRLLGVASTRRPFTQIARPVLPLTWAAFAVAAITGSLLFISKASDYFLTTTFRVKLIIMALAALNMLVFEFHIMKGVRDWDGEPTPPTAARLAGGISLACWLLVFVFGRWTGFTVQPA